MVLAQVVVHGAALNRKAVDWQLTIAYPGGDRNADTTA
jgi:hypothetical protein